MIGFLYGMELYTKTMSIIKQGGGRILIAPK